MRRIVWTDKALTDLERLRKFLEEKSPDSVSKMFDAFGHVLDRLLHAPLTGKPIFDPPGYREWLVRFGNGGYVLRYRVDSAAVYIVNARHYRESDFK